MMNLFAASGNISRLADDGIVPVSVADDDESNNTSIDISVSNESLTVEEFGSFSPGN